MAAAAVLGIMWPEPMSVTIEIDAPQLLPHLLTRLEAGGCSAQADQLPRLSRGPPSRRLSADEALCELRFFVRAWAGLHGDVAVSLWPDG